MSVLTEELTRELSKIVNCSNIDFERSEQNSVELTKLLKDLPSYAQLQKAGCLIEKLFRKTGLNFSNGFYKVNQPINDWITDYQSTKIADKVYPYSFEENLNSNMIVKIEETDDAIREYYIGHHINTLLESIPNFVYTFGAIKGSNNDTHTALLIQQLSARSLSTVLGEITDISDFLDLYCQLLIALEIAQRELSFCHYDLHVDNVLILELKKEFSYTVSFESQTFRIKTKRIPVIIDFGLSCIYTNQTVGNNNIRYAGIYTTLVSGEDMYKLLFTSSYSCKKELFEEMKKLFSFFKNDPYNVKNLSQEEMSNIYYSSFVKKIPISGVATNTPLEMLSWICNNYDIRSVKKQTRRFSHSNESVEIIDFQPPNLQQFTDLCNGILETPINGYKNGSESFDKKVDEFTEATESYNGFLSYIKKLYARSISPSTIKKLKNTEMYAFYVNQSILVERTKRWAHTVLTFE